MERIQNGSTDLVLLLTVGTFPGMGSGVPGSVPLLGAVGTAVGSVPEGADLIALRKGFSR
jgi:hypothetical protein